MLIFSSYYRVHFHDYSKIYVFNQRDSGVELYEMAVEGTVIDPVYKSSIWLSGDSTSGTRTSA